MEKATAVQIAQRKKISFVLFQAVILAIPVVGWVFAVVEAFKAGGKSRVFLTTFLKVLGLGVVAFLSFWLMMFQIASLHTGFIFAAIVHLGICTAVSFGMDKASGFIE